MLIAIAALLALDIYKADHLLLHQYGKFVIWITIETSFLWLYIRCYFSFSAMFSGDLSILSLYITDGASVSFQTLIALSERLKSSGTIRIILLYI